MSTMSSTPSPSPRSHRHRIRRPLAVAAIAAAALVVAGCGGQNPFEAGASATTVDPAFVDGGAVVDNDFMPEEQNLSDCLGSLQRPGCGSDARGGWRQYLTMAVLAAGLAFVGWRISRGVRARDAVVNRVSSDGGDGIG